METASAVDFWVGTGAGLFVDLNIRESEGPDEMNIA